MKNEIKILNSKVGYWEYHPEMKKTIVMVHGFRGTHEGLEEIAKRLPNFRLIVPDLPGFGWSEPFKSGAHDIKNYALFLNKFLNELHLEKPVLLGHSFGSIIAAHFAAEHTSKISKLILINPINAPALSGPRGLLTRLAILYYWMGKKLPASAAKALLSNKAIVFIMSTAMAKTNDKTLRKQIHNNHYTHFSRFANPRVVQEAFRASASRTAREVAPKLTVPTLIIVGDKDDVTALAVQKQALKDYPQASMKIIENVGHLIHYEKPDEAAKFIKEFV